MARLRANFELSGYKIEFNVLSSKGGVLVYFSDFGHVSVFKILLLKLSLVCWIRIWKRFYKNWSITYLKLSLKSGHFQINMKRLMLDYLWYIQISTLYIVYANKTLSVYTVYTNKPLFVYTVYTNKLNQHKYLEFRVKQRFSGWNYIL